MFQRLTDAYPYKILSVPETTYGECVAVCEIHGNFNVLYSNAVRGKSFCPYCSEHGYRRAKGGKFYIHNIYLNNEIVGIKYGITNGEVEERAKQTQRGSVCKVENVVYWESDGDSVLKLESLVAIVFGGKYLSKELLPFGYTETLSPLVAPKLVEFVKTFIF